MPDRSRTSRDWACEDDARHALQQVALSLSSGPVAVSVRWRRSGADGFLMVPHGADPAASDTVVWFALQPGGLPQEEGGSPMRGGVGGRRGRMAAEPVPPAGPVASPESALHRHLYRQRGDVAAVVRCRPTFCTALACIVRIQETGIPAFHLDLVPAVGGSLRCAVVDPFDPFDSSDPSAASAAFERIAAALADRSACLLAARGLLATGATLQAAAQRTAEIEALAQIYWRVLLLEGASA